MKTNEELLLNAKGWNQGAKVSVVGPEMRQLFDAGLIGRSGGLTRKGSIAAERAKRAELNAAFGAL